MDKTISQDEHPEDGSLQSGHKTCNSKHKYRINSIRSSYPVTDLAGLRIFLAVIRETLTSISEKDRLIEDFVPDGHLQAELETAREFRAEGREFIQQSNDFLEDQQASSRGSMEKRTGFIQCSHQDQVRSSCLR